MGGGGGSEAQRTPLNVQDVAMHVQDAYSALLGEMQGSSYNIPIQCLGL